MDLSIIIIILVVLITVLIIVVFMLLSKPKPTKNNAQIVVKKEQPKSIWDSMFKSTVQKKIDVFVFGHGGSGKSSFIQRTFTAGVEPIVSTDSFSYYEFEEATSFNNPQNKVIIRIADYRGQAPAQLLEAIQKNTKIDCLIFLVDIAPTYHLTDRKYDNAEIIHMLTENVEGVIHDRLKDHEEHMSKFLLQIIFQYAMNPSLRKVYLVINKVDFLFDLQKRGTIPKETDIEQYAKSFFFKIEETISTFCTSNHIPHFKVFVISAYEYYNTTRLKSDIINS